MNEIKTNEFDYSLLSDDLAKRLKEKDYILIGLHSKYSKEVGKVLYEAQRDFSDHNNGGLFERWYTSRGFKKTNVYQYINIYNEVQNLNDDQLEVFGKLPKSLQVEASKKSADPELKQKVLDGDITTHKQYKEILRAKEEAEQAKQQAESQAETERKERERLEQENEELASVEPERIEVVPDDYDYYKGNYESAVNLQKRYKDQMEEMRKELNVIHESMKKEKSRIADGEAEEKEKEVKIMMLDASKSVLKTKITIDEFLQEVAFTSYRRGAIASSSDGTKNKLREGIDDLKNFIKEMEMALDGTIEYQ